MGNRDGSAAVGDRLLVIVSEAISEWIAKGEVIDRYYNPGDRFREVHLLLTNNDAPPAAAVRRLVGSAEVFVHNLPTPPGFQLRTLGWKPRLVRAWAGGSVTLASEIRPDLIRCHGAHLNGICALEIRKALGVPVVVSLHTFPSDPANPTPVGLRERFDAIATRGLSRTVLREADLVLAVYASLVPYLERLGARRVELAYNVLNANSLKVKQDYSLHQPVRLISVGRQIPGKDPRNLIRAVATRPGLELTLVGSGSLSADIARLVASLGTGDRVKIMPAVPNDQLVLSLADHDVFAAHNDYNGVPKAILEGMLAGLPILLNRGAHGSVPELQDSVCLLVDDTEDGYGGGLDRLVLDRTLRERLGRNACVWAASVCSPESAEQRVVDLYDELLAGRN